MTNNNQQKPVITFKNVCLAFGDKVILKDLSFEVYPKEIVSIIGPSGAGKSTILKLITGLLEPDSGEVTVTVTRFGMAFQNAALFNSMTVWENIALALKETTHMSSKEIKTRVTESLDIVGLAESATMYPEELSGGMQKRVGIARALALHPDILLYDEPSTGLDPATAFKLEDDMLRLREKIGLTSVVVTHDINTVQHVSDRVLILGENKIIWEGAIDEFMTSNGACPRSFRERKALEECLETDKKT
jgi:phospholipid/cholesterol/gamma-HCH transport system ATP-binding protein